MKIQVTGLPGSGKTTALKTIPIDRIDLAKYSGKNREEHFFRDAQCHPGPVIIESVCGCPLKNTKVIRFVVSRAVAQKNFYKREHTKLSDTLIDLYEPEMLPCHYKVYDQRALKDLVIKLIDNKQECR